MLSAILRIRISPLLPTIGCRPLSSWTQRGHDLTAEMLTWDGNAIPKTVITGYASTGFEVNNIVKKVNPYEDSDGQLHMNGSIMAFPNGAFLWKITHPKEITLESLQPVILHRPKIDYLFIGCNRKATGGGVPRDILDNIARKMRRHDIAVEQLNVADAIGTFNILNAEDRRVAVALVIDTSEEEDDDML